MLFFSLVYGSSRSSHPDSELLHRQTYGTPHPLQGYATNHHPGTSGQGGAWSTGRSLGLSGLFDTGLHHASPSGPDASVMNLISALESRGAQPPPSASSLLSQFRTPSWQTGWCSMHTPAPAELFISGALPGSGSFPTSSALSAYQHPASFSGRSFPTSLSLQDTPTFSPSSNGLLSPHDSLLHIKTPSQSTLGFDRLLTSQSANASYRGVQESTSALPTQAPVSSSSRHLPPQFNLLSSQLQDQSSQLYNSSVFSSAPPQPPQSQERAIPRQDSVIKHYQRPSPGQSQLSSSAPHPLQHYLNCGSSGYQQILHHRQSSSINCSPLGEQSPSSDLKPSPRSDQVYRPIIQPPYTPSSVSSSAVSNTGIGKAGKSSSSSSGYSSSGSTSSRTPHTPPSASSTTSSSSTASNPNAPSSTSSGPSRQQPPPQSASQPPPPPPPTSSATQQQQQPKPCLSTYGSPVAPVKQTIGLPGQTPPQQQSYSPSQPPTSHLPQPYGGFSSPQAQDLGPSLGGSGKAYGSLGATGRSFSAEVVYGSDSGYGSLPSSLGGAGSPSVSYGGPGHSPAMMASGGASGASSSTSGSGASSSGSVGGGSIGGNTSVASGAGSYHLPDSSPSPSSNSGLIRPGLHSPAPSHPAQSPVGNGSNKYLSSVLSPPFLASPQGYSDSRVPPQQTQSYHTTPPKSKPDSDLIGVERSQEEEEEDEEDFLIQHLLHSQSSAPNTSQHPSHHAQQEVPQAPPRSISQGRDSGKALTSYEHSKASDERYPLQSVIRTNNLTNNVVAESCGQSTGLESQLEMSLKKHQNSKADRVLPGPNENRAQGAVDSMSHNHAHGQHDSLSSVVHYGRGDPYAHQPPHPSQSQQPQHSHTNSMSQLHMDLKKTQDPSELSYLRKTPDLQQRQSQSALGLMDSPPDPSQQTSQAHLLQSVLSHTTQNKMENQIDPSQQHSLSQQAMVGPTGGLGTPGSGRVDTQSQASQLQLQLQSQKMEVHYGREAQRNQSQNSVSPLDMLERSISRANSQEGTGPSDRVGSGEGRTADHHRQQQHRMSSQHQSHHSQTSSAELHDFLSESDVSMPTRSHLHHMASHHPPPHTLLHPQTHSHHQNPHDHSHHMQAAPGPLQPQSQPREQERHLSQSQLDRIKENQYDTGSPVGKTTQSQSQDHQQRFMPLTSICFPDSLLQDEDRSFFPGMEDMFCSEDFKASCVGVGGQGVQGGVPEGQGTVQDGMDSVKTTGGRGAYDMMGHHSDQGYGQYCHNLSESGNGPMHLDMDPLKSHELPSTVNTEQLGLIQSQGPGLGMGNRGHILDGAGNKMMSSVGLNSGTGLTSPIFCSSRPKKLLKTSSFHLLKQRKDPVVQSQTKKNYAQEYEFEDDEDKADVPADIRLNSRRLPDLLPDLVSSCRKSGGSSGVGSLSPLMSDLDFCHPSGFSSLGPPPLLLPNEGPKKRGRKPTKPKREGPPRPRGRPRIRPLPEPPYCRNMPGPGGEGRRGRGRGRGRGRKEDPMREMHIEMNKRQNYHQQAPHLNHQPQLQQHMHHHLQQHQHQPQHMHQQQHLNVQQMNQQHHQQLGHHQPQQQYQEPIKPIKIKLPIPSMSSSDSLLRTDSLSSTDPVLSDGSVGSAPSLGMSPGSTTGVDLNRVDMNRNDLSCGQEKMRQKPPEQQQISWDGDMDDQMPPDAWATMQKLSSSIEEKSSELKSGFITSFLDFLKTGKKPAGTEASPGDGCATDSSPLKGGIRPLSPQPPPPPSHFEENEGDGSLGLSNCPSPCKRLDEELKRNLETLPSFSSDEEDSVSKNHDLQKSISSAISALYDTPHSLAAVPPPTPSPATPQSLNTPPHPDPDLHLHPEPDLHIHTAQEVESHSRPNPKEEAHVSPENEEEPEPEMHQKSDTQTLEKGEDMEEGRIGMDLANAVRTEEGKQSVEEEAEFEMLEALKNDGEYHFRYSNQSVFQTAQHDIHSLATLLGTPC
ncbi:hypothetical protein DNTS_017598 [Danionella cerebrum]|uniref:DUF4211 domain-containing protein n=1 Tax=Danionella cerebrum TaxID=2873325 RepID=A0A553N3B5_9TELE|nr:hypothetical protein DNTS_017598 [Danionella translucida]